MSAHQAIADVLNATYDDLAGCLDNALLNSYPELDFAHVRDLSAYELGELVRPFGRGCHVSGLLRTAHYCESLADIDRGDLGTGWHPAYRDERLDTYRYWAMTAVHVAA